MRAAAAKRPWIAAMARSPSTFRQNDVTRAPKAARTAAGDPSLPIARGRCEPGAEKPVRRRKPTLRAALVAAQKAGKAVRSATVKDGEIVLEFGEPTPDTSDEWDRKLAELDRDKH
jgi:hypothetical protein